jgi:SAM-dependent methyltransferase
MQYILAIFILVICLPLAIAGISMAPWVPTRKKDITRLLNILNLNAWDRFLEIGCGDGRVSSAVAKQFPEAKILGIELAFPMYFIARLRNLGKPGNLNFKLANAFKQDFWKYDVIYVYGMPDKMWAKIIPKFISEAKFWAKLYSYVFSIPKEYSQWVISHGKENEAKIHVLEKK